jgi:D-alanyl-D-alanine carboxypeptidase
LKKLPPKFYRAVVRILVAFVLIVPVASVRAAQEVLDKATEAKVDELANDVLKKIPLAGMAIGVMHDGHLILAKGYGMENLEDGTPVRPDTVFRIGSITKQFTAASIMLLKEQGKLAVGDKLSKYFPSFPRGDEVTLRQLMNHIAGIHNYTNKNYLTVIGRIDKTMPEFVDFIAHQDPVFDFDPGTKWNYSNSNYFILGAIVEKVSGMSLHDFLKNNIFDKVGMKDSALDTSSDVVLHRAAGYELHKENPGVFYNADFLSLTTVGGAGEIRSTVEDLAKWHYALFNGQVVSRESFQEMTTPGLLNNGQPSSTGRPPSPTKAEYGYGLMIETVDGHRRIGHGGTINGYVSSIRTYIPENLTIVVCTNTQDAGKTAYKVEPDVARIVLRRISSLSTDR